MGIHFIRTKMSKIENNFFYNLKGPTNKCVVIKVEIG